MVSRVSSVELLVTVTVMVLVLVLVASTCRVMWSGV